jgi:hypothetical protein
MMTESSARAENGKVDDDRQPLVRFFLLGAARRHAHHGNIPYSPS